jgi:hypothetical protein
MAYVANRKLVLEILGENPDAFSPCPPARLYRHPGVRPSGRPQAVPCQGARAGADCAAPVRVKSFRVWVKGWLRVDVYLGRCPGCGRVYWA